MDNAFKEIEKLGGIPTEASYPYVSGAGKKEACETSKAKVATLTGFTDVPTKSETGLVAALDKGPVSVAVEADKSVFQSYKSGVIKSILCGTNLDHGVLAVGYGTDAGTDYYKVKNSWGATWGVEGYLKIERGHNTCGIETQPSYPTGVKPLGPTPPGPTPPGAYEKQQVFDEKVPSTVSFIH
jgi:C1A family cysteine protease